MDNTKKGKLFSILAAVCFAGFGLFTGNAVLQTILSVRPVRLNFAAVFFVLFCVVYLGLAVTLLINRMDAVYVAAAVCASFWFIQAFMSFSVPILFEVLAYISFAFLLFVLEDSYRLKKLCFLPAVLMLIGNIIAVVQDMRLYPFSYCWPTLVLQSFESFALLFAGLWLRSITSHSSDAPTDSEETPADEDVFAAEEDPASVEKASDISE